MKKVAKLFRVSEWYTSKLPLLLAVLFLSLLYDSIIVSDVWRLILCYFVFCSCFLALGYYANDLFDIELDKMAGKKKVIAGIRPVIRIFILILLVAICFVPMLVIYPSWYMAGAIAITVFFGLQYSMPPFRFKRFGLMGLIISSSAQRCLPLLPLLATGTLNLYIFAFMITLSFINGLRYILIHQYSELKEDQASGLDTFVVKRGRTIAKNLIITSFIIESLCAAFLCGFLIWLNLYYIIGVVIFFFCFVLKIISVKVFSKSSVLFDFYYVPLEDFFNLFLALALLVGLAFIDLYFSVALAIVTLIYLVEISKGLRLSFGGIKFIMIKLKLYKKERPSE